MVFISLTFGLLFGGRVNFAKELELLKQDREKTKRLQEELIQSRKMQEELNQQIRRSQKNRTSSMNSSMPMPNKVMGLWEIYTSTRVVIFRRNSRNTKKIGHLSDGEIVPVFQYKKYKSEYGSDMVWMEVEYEKGKIGWVDLYIPTSGQWVEKY